MHSLRFFKYNPNVFAATSDGGRDWSELDYVVRMTAPIIEFVFRDTGDSLRLRWYKYFICNWIINYPLISKLIS
jgi:hypothetical protein